MDVVILAGGVGRRFGGVKQLAPVTPDGAVLLEVTLRDARRAGCDRAVIVTAADLVDDVRALLDERPIDGLGIEIVTQRTDDLPLPVDIERAKPWGTAHALWAARDAVRDPFLLFNADDHYGPGAPAALIEALRTDADRPVFALLGYPLGATLSPDGTVSRGVCEVRDGRLTGLREHPTIDSEGRSGGTSLPLDVPVSMNAWAFTPDVFPLLERFLRRFLETADLAADEAYLPAAIDDAVQAGKVEVRVPTAPDRWCGMTWPDDRERVARRLAGDGASWVAAAGFGLDDVEPAHPFGDGLIHDAWRIGAAQGPHLLQRLNTRVFPDPAAVADNAAAAARRVADALHRRGDDDPRHRLSYRVGPDGRPWFRDRAGGVWRAASFLADTRPADPSRPDETRAAARLLGGFPGLVAEGEGSSPTVVLPGFHDTPARLDVLRTAAARDAAGRLASCRADVDRLLDLALLADRLPADLPERFVHNDAKLDNVLVDARTGEALCVVDLDTVMPGFAPHDFGDLVRSAVTGRPEDEPDLDRVTLRVATFSMLAEGYLEGAREWIEPSERAALVDGALVIAYEQAARFLADHLDGDVYYPVDVAGHNLRRARAQTKLLTELLSAEDELRRLIAAL